MSDSQIKNVTLKEMLEAMAHYNDDEVFRWYQTSYTSSINGNVQINHGPTLKVTFGQARRELGLKKG